MDLLSDEEYQRYYNTLRFSVEKEGGYVNKRNDPGGETKWGISKRYHPNEDIKNLTPQRAADIYYNKYWIPSGARLLPEPDCTACFDTAILCGPGRTRRWYQQSKGNIRELLAIRRRFHIDQAHKFPDLREFLVGWVARVNDLQRYCELRGFQLRDRSI